MRQGAQSDVKEQPGSDLPWVTVGIPTYKRYDQLRSCLQEVLLQSYPNIDILVSDNTQDSETPSWIKEILESDERVRYVRQRKNLGAVGNHQYLIDHALGEYFMFLHDDDVISRDYVKNLMDHLLSNPSVALIGPRCDRYLDGKYWLTYENWDSRGKDTFTRLFELIPDAFSYHWRFEQYMYGIFRLKGLNYKMSQTFKGQFHLFFLLSDIGELMCAENVVIQKHTTNEELEKYKTGGTYKRYLVLKMFSDNDVKSAQQSIPICIQVTRIVLASDNLRWKEKRLLVARIFTYFKQVVIKHEIVHFKYKYRKAKSRLYHFIKN